MTKGLVLITLAALAGSANAAGAVELTKENFATLTKGKNSFVKFVSLLLLLFGCLFESIMTPIILTVTFSNN